MAFLLDYEGAAADICVSVTCAMNWIIFTKMFRGISLGTTPRDPLGKSVVVMVMSRLEDKGGRKRENKAILRLEVG